ncbi:MAG: hypothetical protein F6K31_23300 [Symploca sp. SIO2G7]|nr:hypothetical protein [Symploca sp. SIO2G7]
MQPRFAYLPVWQTIDEPTRKQVIAFWNEHGAITDADIAEKRVNQVVAIARNQSDQAIAGVCTVIKRDLADLGKVLFYYRTFVAEPYRNAFVMGSLMRTATEFLENWSRENPEQGAAGMYLELENASFSTHLRQAVWPRRGLEFVYIGNTPGGLERRVLWFKHTTI